MTFADFVNIVIGIIGLAIPVVFALSVIAVLAGGVILIAKAGGEEKSNTGKQMLLWGIIFLVVAITVWSIVGVVRVTFGL